MGKAALRSPVTLADLDKAHNAAVELLYHANDAIKRFHPNLDPLPVTKIVKLLWDRCQDGLDDVERVRELFPSTVAKIDSQSVWPGLKATASSWHYVAVMYANTFGDILWRAIGDAGLDRSIGEPRHELALTAETLAAPPYSVALADVLRCLAPVDWDALRVRLGNEFNEAKKALRAERKTETQKKIRICKSDDAKRLAHKIKHDKTGASMKDIAREFTDNDEDRAENLLRTLRNHPALLGK